MQHDDFVLNIEQMNLWTRIKRYFKKKIYVGVLLFVSIARHIIMNKYNLNYRSSVYWIHSSFIIFILSNLYTRNWV